MSQATLSELDEARRYVSRLVKRGAMVVPPGSPFVRATVELLELVMATDQLAPCEHIEAARHIGFAVLPTFDGGDHRMMRPLCLACFESEPLQPVCQVCLRQPSPGLRTVVARHQAHAVVLVGRLCRDCRPGRVA